MDIRCEHKLHAIIPEKGTIEVKCSSRFCGAVPGVVVIHRFDSETGALLSTRKYKDVVRRKDNGSR